MTKVNVPDGNEKLRTSPSRKIKSERPARCGILAAKDFGLRVSTTAEAFNPRWSLAQAKLSNSQQPKNPVPPVMKIRCPRNSSQSPSVWARTGSRSAASGFISKTTRNNSAGIQRQGAKRQRRKADGTKSEPQPPQLLSPNKNTQDGQLRLTKTLRLRTLASWR